VLKSKKYKKYITYLPIYGCISTGVIYLGIGIIAILSFLKLKEGGADESSLLAFLNDYIAGRIFFWIILLGTTSYILWRFYEAVTDPYEYGKKTGGIAKRIGIGLSTAADILIVYSAITILIGTSNAPVDGQPEEQRMMVNNLLQHRAGSVIVTVSGIIVILTAVVQFVYGVSRGYKERLNISRFSSFAKSLIHFFAWTGYFARGIIIGITGFFLAKSGIVADADYVVNTDKAFDFIGDHVGHVPFIIVALGTICYALFMFSLGISYDADKD
jgi:Domain of Unknown Function (DUF1206)